MKENEMLSILSDGVSSYPFTNLLAATAIRQSKLAPEEKAEREERWRLLEEQRIRKYKIIKNVCPDCEGKLIRGKKDKRNGYKRVWVCGGCGGLHSL